MVTKRGVQRLALLLIALVVSTALGSPTAAAAELSDYRWEKRPLLLFAPADSDPRLAETLGRIGASRCDFIGRDMVTGVVRVDEVPDLRRIYAVIDGMPMRSREVSADPRRC